MFVRNQPWLALASQNYGGLAVQTPAPLSATGFGHQSCMSRFSRVKDDLMLYTKPHLPFDQQVKLLASRGMDTGDEGDAVRSLRRIGYYRFSGYSYTFRQVDHPTGQRLDRFEPGTTLKGVVALHDFDSRLRHTMGAGLQALEIGFRVKVAYHLGKASPLAHLDPGFLDPVNCAKPPRWKSDKLTTYESWRDEYDSLQRKAEREDYVGHFTRAYGGDVPIWAACELMTMGCLVALFDLLQSKDRRRIADELEVKDPKVLSAWLRALNVLRNHCAHNARIWNRKTIYPPAQINTNIVPADLHHLCGADTDRLYFLATTMAFLLRRIDAQTRWPSDFRTTMSKFPQIVGATTDSIGVVEGWRDESVWRAQDRSKRG